MKEKITIVIIGVFVVFAKIANEAIQVNEVYRSLSMKEKLEFWKVISFGILINGIYGLFHGNLWDAFTVFGVLYAIMKIIKKERS